MAIGSDLGDRPIWKAERIEHRPDSVGGGFAGDLDLRHVAVMDRSEMRAARDKCGHGVLDAMDHCARGLRHRVEPRMRIGSRAAEIAHHILCEDTADEAPVLEIDPTEVTCLEALDLLRSHQPADLVHRSEEHTSELQSLMRISYAVFCLKKKKPRKK